MAHDLNTRAYISNFLTDLYITEKEYEFDDIAVSKKVILKNKLIGMIEGLRHYTGNYHTFVYALSFFVEFKKFSDYTIKMMFVLMKKYNIRINSSELNSILKKIESDKLKKFIVNMVIRIENGNKKY